MMIAKRGGLQTLRESRLGLLVLKIIILHNYVLCATFNLDIPIRDSLTDDVDFDIYKTVSSDLHVLESFFYCPREDFLTLRNSALCKPHTLGLITEIRDYIALIEAESNLTSAHGKHAVYTARLALRARLLSHPAISSPSAPAYLLNDSIYESVRLTSLILLRLSDTCLPVQIAFSPSRASPSDTRSPGYLTPAEDLVPLLCKALRATPFSTGWEDMLGVLYVVVIIGTCASRGKPEFAFLSSVGMRCMFDMCYEDSTWASTIRPMQRFIWLQRVLLNGGVRKIENVDPTWVPTYEW